MEFFDVNSDGHITKQEMLSVLMNNGPVNENAMTAFVVMDKDGDGIVISEEFYKAIPTLLKAGAIDNC